MTYCTTTPIKKKFCVIFVRSCISSHKSLCAHPLYAKCFLYGVNGRSCICTASQPGKRWSETVGKHQHLSVLAQLSYLTKLQEGPFLSPFVSSGLGPTHPRKKFLILHYPEGKDMLGRAATLSPTDPRGIQAFARGLR